MNGNFDPLVAYRLRCVDCLRLRQQVADLEGRLADALAELHAAEDAVADLLAEMRAS